MTSLVWLGSFGWYLLSCSPSLGGEDSGEFTAAAATLGVGHAPGYPLFALAGRLMCLLPLGSVAFRLNLFSAAAAATAVTLLFDLVFRVARDSFGLSRRLAIACAVTAAATLGLSQALWYQAVISDKYAVHLALFAVAAGLSARSASCTTQAFWLGLGFAHHLQMLYLVPGLAATALRSGRMTTRRVVLAASLFLLGLSPKLIYPPVRAVQSPPLLLAAPGSIKPFIRYQRAAVFAGRVPGPSWIRWRETGEILVGQLGVPGVVLGVLGLLALGWRSRHPAVLLLLTGVTGASLAASLAITGREFYMLPVVWVLAVGIGCGAAYAFALDRTAPGRFRIAIVVVLAVPCLVGVRSAPWRHRADVSLEYDTGRDLLVSLPARTALFVGEDDFIYPLFHLQLVERFRPDVLVIPEGALTSPAWRRRLASGAPELAELLARPVGFGDEDTWSRIAVGALRRAGCACVLTNPMRAGVWRGARLEPRELVYEIVQGTARVPLCRAEGLRARGWFAPVEALTERERWLLALYGDRQRRYAEWLAATGRAGAARSRFRRALSNPYLVDRAGTARDFAASEMLTGW